MTDRRRFQRARGELRRQWQAQAVPPFDRALGHADAGTRGTISRLRSIYREQLPRRSAELMCRQLLAPRDRSRFWLPAIAVLAAALLIAIQLWPRLPVDHAADRADASRSRALVVRADGERTEILLGRVRFVFVNPPVPPPVPPLSSFAQNQERRNQER